MKKNLSRSETIQLIWRLAMYLYKNGYNRRIFNRCFTLANEWNDKNPNQLEIFVYEDYDNNGNLIIYVEDDYLIIKK